MQVEISLKLMVNPLHSLHRWNGRHWSDVGGGMNGTVRVLCVYKGELYAGGEFTTAGNTTANHIAKWNGKNWITIDSGLNGSVFALTIFNGELYAGGANLLPLVIKSSIILQSGIVNHGRTWEVVLMLMWEL